MNRITKMLMAAAVVLAAACNGVGTSTENTEGADHEHVGAVGDALTAAQCNYFAVNGKVQICHRTASTNHPFTIVKVNEQACVNAHAVHAGDYVAVNDPTCSGGGCLPQNAPSDATLPCCDGFSCTSGVCTANVSDHCAPSPCQNGGSCVNGASSYTCNCPAGYTGNNCQTEIDECASNPCVNGQCLDGINSYTCECAPGWTGANCNVDINECASSPCVNGNCVDLINAYSCVCPSGYTGTNCETAVVSGYDCAANNPCTHTADVDEAQRVFGGIFTEATLAPLDRATFGCTLDVVASDGVRSVADEWSGGGHPQLRHHPPAVTLHDPLGDAEIGGDLLVEHPARDPLTHVPLARGERHMPCSFEAPGAEERRRGGAAVHVAGVGEISGGEMATRRASPPRVRRGRGP